MEVLLYVLIGIGCIAAFLGELWFLVVAFRVSVVWGLVCLFIPFAALVFLIKYWNEAKVPFLTSLAGAVIGIIGIMGLAAHTASSAVGDFAEVTFEEPDDLSDERPVDDWWEDQEPSETTPTVAPPEEMAFEEPSDQPYEDFPEEDQPVLLEDDGQFIGDSGVEPLLEADEVAPEPTQPPRRWREWGVQVPLAELPSRIGQRVEIHTLDGRAHKAELESVGPDSIKVRQRMGAGHMSYSISIDKIVEVRGRE